MKIPTPLQTLKDTEQIILNEVIKILNTRGYIFEYDGENSLGSFVMKNWNDSCTDFLRKHGYTGSRLLGVGKFYPEYGNCFMVAKGTIVNNRSHIDLLDKYVKEKVI